MKLISQLKKELQKNLPAEKAHARVMSYQRKSAQEILDSKIGVKESAVLCLLFQENDSWKFYLMLRNAYKGTHSAQVSFPGGKKELEDKDFTATALREAHEELNIQSQDVQILGGLSPLYIPPSNFLVYPILAFTNKAQHIIPDAIEVAELIVGDINDIIGNEVIHRSKVPMSGSGSLIEVNHYSIQGHVVWGATAMILAELAWLLQKALADE